MNTRLTFGEWLTDQLQRRGMTQTVLASTLDTSQSAVSHWVNDNARPTRRNVRAIADVLGIEREEALMAAGYAPPRPYRVGATVVDPDAEADLEDAIEARLRGENVSHPRIWASMNDALAALGATDHDKEVIARFVEFTLAESRRREAEST